jgi:RimJ/RimL family protein N-acetyltransferase
VQRFSSRRYGGRVDVKPPEPPLSDGVVMLRPWTQADVPAIAAACAEEEIARWLHLIPQPYTKADAREYVVSSAAGWRDGTGATFAVVERSGPPVGSIGMRVLDREHRVVEVGYWTAAAARGRGLTTRALQLISAWLVAELGAERVQLRADVLNVASRRVAEKAGFVMEGVLRSSDFNPRQGRRIDYAMYSLLPGEPA